MICRILSEVVTRTTWTEATDHAERHLVECAVATVATPAPDGGIEGPIDERSDSDLRRRYTVEEIGRLAIRIREHLDPDGSEPRDAVKQSLRGFSYPRVGADGMARGRYALPPLQLGVFLTAIDSILSPRTPDATATDTTAPEEEHTALDSRTAEQRLLDAVMTLIEMAAASPQRSRLDRRQHRTHPDQHGEATAVRRRHHRDPVQIERRCSEPRQDPPAGDAATTKSFGGPRRRVRHAGVHGPSTTPRSTPRSGSSR